MLPARVEAFANSGYPQDHNNGAAWAGKGLTTQASAGATFRWDRLTVRIEPVVVFQQNLDFDLPVSTRNDRSPYAFPWIHDESDIDWPQRQGGEAFWTVHPGNSSIDVDLDAVRLGASTANLWSGPARRYPLILSNTAPGFPHVYVRAPSLDLRIVDVELGAISGRLQESDWFDFDAGNDYRLLNVWTFGLRPSAYPNLSLGMALAYMQTLDDGRRYPTLREVLRNAGSETTGVSASPNGVMSMFGRWVAPSVGLEVYLEWGRDDRWWDFNDFVSEPDHSSAFTAGFGKATPWRKGQLLLSGEVTRLHSTSDYRSPRARASWYAHWGVQQGYTNRGQLLGSFIGPGSDAQYLGAEYLEADRLTGLFMERIRWDEEIYNERFAATYGFRGHDVELSVGGRHARPLTANLRLDASFALSFRRNRNFLSLDGVAWSFPWTQNLHARLGLSWSPGG